jgi:hypothetical protein
VGKAVFYFLVEPLPWRIDSLFQFLVLPQVMTWSLFVVPCAMAGIFWSLMRNPDRSLFLVLLVLAWTLMGALTNGNVGTAFRIRDMVTPLYLTFGWVGFWAFARGLAVC